MELSELHEEHQDDHVHQGVEQEAEVFPYHRQKEQGEEVFYLEEQEERALHQSVQEEQVSQVLQVLQEQQAYLLKVGQLVLFPR